MTRIQFIIVTGLSTIVSAGVLLNIFLVHSNHVQEFELLKRQHSVQQGQLCLTRVQQLANRIAQVSQQTQDPALKDLMTRQGITVTPRNDAGADPAPAATR